MKAILKIQFIINRPREEKPRLRGLFLAGAFMLLHDNGLRDSGAALFHLHMLADEVAQLECGAGVFVRDRRAGGNIDHGSRFRFSLLPVRYGDGGLIGLGDFSANRFVLPGLRDGGHGKEGRQNQHP